MERRKFIKAACAIGGLAMTPAFIESCTKEENTAAPAGNFTVDLSDPANAALAATGGHLIKNGVMIIHTAAGYTALSSVCTHQGCTVNYQANSSQLVCPCHGGTFDITGKVLGGPPPGPLHQYVVTQNGTVLTVK